MRLSNVSDREDAAGALFILAGLILWLMGSVFISIMLFAAGVGIYWRAMQDA